MENRKLTWKEKYQLSLNEYFTLKEIMQLRDCGKSSAIAIREKAIDYCIINDYEVGTRKILAEAVFEVTQKDTEFYYDKMMLETLSELSYSINEENLSEKLYDAMNKKKGYS
ncbi:hypothetical protein SDC9_124527 [bioreactor metagenome]|uniref:Uncharacterized protein n=1 Tax=bioreactor metagenome TaxID=1076179 RepID=A0A645CKN9_9ZZZZ|nr:hypothetical protein [Anaerorhabdus sp.]MEA4875273.1 hypothetical protein [Anaerorhabdus sp.]